MRTCCANAWYTFAQPSGEGRSDGRRRPESSRSAARRSRSAVSFLIITARFRQSPTRGGISGETVREKETVSPIPMPQLPWRGAPGGRGPGGSRTRVAARGGGGGGGGRGGGGRRAEGG